MTLMAREVLNDCRDALAEFEHGVQGGKRRRCWIMNVTLLRAVGHVLQKVDGARVAAAGKATKEAWPEIKAAKLLSHFIENERNVVLEEYKLGATQNTSMTLRSQATYGGRRAPRSQGSRFMPFRQVAHLANQRMRLGSALR